MDTTTALGALSVLATACAIFFGYAAFRRNAKQDDQGEAKESGIMLTEIGYVKSGIDDIKRKQEQQETQHIEVVTRITAVEESAKQAHKRLDRIENNGGTA